MAAALSGGTEPNRPPDPHPSGKMYFIDYYVDFLAAFNTKGTPTLRPEQARARSPGPFPAVINKYNYLCITKHCID